MFHKNKNLNLKLIAVKVASEQPDLSPSATYSFIVKEMILSYVKVRKQCKHAQLSFHIVRWKQERPISARRVRKSYLGSARK